MPTYDFECSSCGARREERFSMADMPASVACQCGQQAQRVILNVPEAFMRFRPYEFRRDRVVGNNGKAFGRTVDQQHEGYRRKFDGIHKNIRGMNRSLSKNRHDTGGFQYLGGMPGEMVDSIGQQEGDKEAVSKDPGTFLKKCGLYVGEGE
jgi:putative FmdB family regulatory protein